MKTKREKIIEVLKSKEIEGYTSNKEVGWHIYEPEKLADKILEALNEPEGDRPEQIEKIKGIEFFVNQEIENKSMNDVIIHLYAKQQEIIRKVNWLLNNQK